MRMMNETVSPGEISEVTQESFELVWEPRGWVEAPVLPDLVNMDAEDVLSLVDEDPSRAAVAHADESRGRSRVKLLAALEKLAFPEAGSPADPPADLGDGPANLSHEAVLSEVAGDPQKAAAALAAERSGRRRKGLMKDLERLTENTDFATVEKEN